MDPTQTQHVEVLGVPRGTAGPSGNRKSAMPNRPHRNLSGEELRDRARKAAKHIDSEIARMRDQDPQFREAHDLALSLTEEIRARKNA
jgi:hypothetical protein